MMEDLIKCMGRSKYTIFVQNTKKSEFCYMISNMVVLGWSFSHSSVALFTVWAVIFIFFQQVSMYLRGVFFLKVLQCERGRR